MLMNTPNGPGPISTTVRISQHTKRARSGASAKGLAGSLFPVLPGGITTLTGSPVTPSNSTINKRDIIKVYSKHRTN